MQRSWKQTTWGGGGGGGGNHPIIPSALNKTITHFLFFTTFAALARPGKCPKSKCTPILGGLASSPPPIDSWSPLPKALLASEEMSEESAFPGTHFCSALAPPSQLWLKWSWASKTHPHGILRSLAWSSLKVFSPPSWGSDFYLPSNPSSLFAGSPHSFPLRAHPPSLIWRSLTR